MKKWFFTGLFLWLTQSVIAQISLSAGPSYLIPFGGVNFVGGHFSVEIPVDDESSYYGRLSIFGNRTGAERTGEYVADAIDPSTTFPYSISLNSANQLRFTNLHLGRRFYFLESYDFGFGLYGSSEVMLTLANARVAVSDFDENKYRLADGLERKGNFFGASIGFSGGAKYSAAFGTVFFDLGINYLFAPSVTNAVAVNSFNEMGSNVFFNFNLGFRKDLF